MNEKKNIRILFPYIFWRHVPNKINKRVKKITKNEKYY